MSFWKMMTAGKSLLLALVVIASSAVMAAPVFAGDSVIVYDNKEKTLKIREISFNGDYSSMSVLVENLATNAEFRIEHDVDTGDTSNEYLEVTATDGTGAVSETVRVENPFYAPPEVMEEAAPIEGALSVTGGDGGFNTSGWASVIDNAESGDKEFFIVRSETGNEFYVMIDREGGNENVYFLNAVTEWDLLGLTQEFEVPNNLDPNSELNAAVEVTDAPPPEETTSNEPPIEPPKSSGIGVFGIILLVIFALAIAAYLYFFKFRRKNGSEVEDGYLPDDYGDEDEEESGEAEDTDEDYDEDEDDLPVQLPIAMKAPPSAERRFADENAGGSDYYDDYSEDVDDEDVLGGTEGGDEDEDNTI